MHRARLSVKRARHFFIGRPKATLYHLLSQITEDEIYLLRELAGLGAPGNFISCPVCNSTSGPMPLSRANSSTDSLRDAAILAIVSPLRARNLVRLALPVSVEFAPRRQFVNLILLLGTTSLLVLFRSTPPFSACSVATLTPVRLATDCSSSPRATEITLAESRRSVGTRFNTESNCF